jgi:methionine salvage enolase-phosphatase E1
MNRVFFVACKVEKERCWTHVVVNFNEISNFFSVYDDVVPALDQWKKQGKTIYIYSSGSVPAQKLLVGYSTKGDLMSVSA